MDISELYYQQMINGNYTSNMLNGLSGNSSNTGENSIASILGMMSGTSGVSGSDILSGGSSLLGTSGVSGDFASVLERYLSSSMVSSQEATSWVQTLGQVLEDVQESGDHTKSTATVQELYDFFQEKMKSESKGIQSLAGITTGETDEENKVSSGVTQNILGQVVDVESGLPDVESIEAEIEEAVSASIIL